jgi:hypothetical protein
LRFAEAQRVKIAKGRGKHKRKREN